MSGQTAMPKSQKPYSFVDRVSIYYFKASTLIVENAIDSKKTKDLVMNLDYMSDRI
jgi:hypothetical protein